MTAVGIVALVVGSVLGLYVLLVVAWCVLDIYLWEKQAREWDRYWARPVDSESTGSQERKSNVR